MLSFRGTALTAGLLALSALLWSTTAPRAVGQDQEKDPPKIVSMFKAGKAIELKVKDGKASYTGELNQDDPMAQAHYFKVFTIKLEKGKTYRIEHREAGDDPQFDPFLFLEDAKGKTLANDDDSAGGLNARIVYKASATGTYRLVATTLPQRQTGKFTLEVKPGTPEDEKAAHLQDLIASYSTAPAAEQKKIVGELIATFRAKAGDLSINDAKNAMALVGNLDERNLALSKSTLKDLVSIFGAAGNPQVAGIAKAFQSTLTHLGLIGNQVEIAGKTVDGKDFDLKNLKGKVVLVDFWATWCGPCIAEMPNIEKAYKKYHEKGFEVIGISLDRSDDAITKFAEARKMKWGSINIEDSKALADKYEVNSIPFPVLVDQAGNVVSIRARGQELDALLERLLGGKGK